MQASWSMYICLLDAIALPPEPLLSKPATFLLRISTKILELTDILVSSFANKNLQFSDFLSWGFKGFQGVSRGFKGFQGVSRGFKGF